MLTRRQILLSAVVLPGVASAGHTGPIEIITESHLLAEESALGYRQALRDVDLRSRPGFRNRLILVPGSCQLTPASAWRLHWLASAGNWIVLEAAWHSLDSALARWQAQIVARVLGVQTSDAALPVERYSYVHYTWPQPALLRTFESFAQVQCSAAEIIATVAGHPVCSKHSIGLGGIVFLGSMLGPGLFGEEREAHTLLQSAARLLLST